jgi:hypothetical protein
MLRRKQVGRKRPRDRAVKAVPDKMRLPPAVLRLTRRPGAWVSPIPRPR